jgi:hypothetical protein
MQTGLVTFQWVLVALPSGVSGGGGGIIDRDVMLTVRLDLVPSLRIRDAIFLLPPCAFMAYTGTNLSSYMEL